MYAHYVFNTLDQSRSGIVSFEVRNGSDDRCNKLTNALQLKGTRFN